MNASCIKGILQALCHVLDFTVFAALRGFSGGFDVRNETVCCVAVAGQTLIATGHELMHKSNLKSL
jgi:hypothetical protein